MSKYSLVMTPTPHRVAGCIFIALYLLGLRIHAFVHLLTYLHNWLGAYKTGNISEMVEDRAKVSLLLTAITASYLKSYTGFRLPPNV